MSALVCVQIKKPILFWGGDRTGHVVSKRSVTAGAPGALSVIWVSIMRHVYGWVNVLVVLTGLKDSGL